MYYGVNIVEWAHHSEDSKRNNRKEVYINRIKMLTRGEMASVIVARISGKFMG